jgi:hypothetical protein
VNWITRFGKLAGVCALGLIAGCGGGGGAGGAGPYTITLRVDRAQLPLNIAGDAPNIGGRYTSTIYIDARDNAGRPIPGGTGTFGCSVTGGLDTGALYYLDGEDAHETTETVNGVAVTYPNAYRAVTLDSNSGTSSFHFHAGDTVGSVVIRCTVTEPTTNIQRTAQTTIQVGGASTGLVSQVVFDRFSPNYLFRQGLPAINGTTQVVAQVRLVDEAGQPVADPPAAANSVQLRIIPDPTTLADDDALLRGVGVSGTAITGQIIHARTINGQAQFTIISGTNVGTILIEALADRSDNNVTNGAATPIVNYIAVPIVASSSSGGGSITIDTTTLPAAAYGVSYGALLEATGGTAPYTWNLASAGLPEGLSLSSTGVVSGTPTQASGTSFSFVARVSDASGVSAQKTFTMSYVPPTTPTPAATAPVISTTALSAATVGTPYAAVMTASGGTAPYAWTAVGLPTGLTMSSTGVISGTPTVGGTYPIGFTVIGANTLTTSSVIDLTVNGGSGGSTSAPTLVPTTLSVSECTTDIPFVVRGGSAPFITYSTDSVNVTTTTPVKPTSAADFYVFTVSTSATSKLDGNYTITVLDGQSRTATAILAVPIATHTVCANFPKLTLSPTAIVATPMTVGTTQVITIQGGGDTADVDTTISFTPNTSDASVVSISAPVTGPNVSNAYQFTIQANAVGTVIISVSSEDGQNAYIPVVVVP